MRKNKDHNNQIVEKLGEYGYVRPHDILRYEQESISLIPNPDRDYRVWVHFNKTHLRCGNHHIFVNESFRNMDEMMKHADVIGDNQHVHIFLSDRWFITANMIDFCFRIKEQTKCTSITIHHSKQCFARDAIDGYRRLYKNILDLKVAIDANCVPTDFQCTNWYGWQSGRVCMVRDGEYEICVYSASYKAVTGLAVFMDKESEKYIARAIYSRFIPEGCMSKREDSFHCTKYIPAK